VGILKNDFIRDIFYGFLGRNCRSLGPTIFSLLSLIVPKKVYPNAATWSSSVWQIASVVGPAVAGFSITLVGFTGLCVCICLFYFCINPLTQIGTKPILNQKIGEPIMESLKEGVKFVFNNKTILGALSLDMVAVLLAEQWHFAQDILK
jgi:MFS family permease